jgi:hypothetical protein
MSFGAELKDFVSGFKAGSSAVHEGQRIRAYRDQIALQKDKSKSDFERATESDFVKDRLKGIDERNKVPAIGGDEISGSDGTDQINGSGGGDQLNDPFNKALNRTLQFEGGYVANDAGKGPTNMGINSTSNPDIDVKNLTRAQASQIYKTRYWDAIGGDGLAKRDPNLAHVAFDTAVNAGPGKAKELLQASGGDANKLLDLRKGFYNSLIENDPGKFGKFSKSWFNRIDTLRGDIGRGSSTLASGTSGAPMGADPAQGALPLDDGYALAPPRMAQQQDEDDEDKPQERSYEARYANPYQGVLAFEDGGSVDQEEMYRLAGAQPQQAPQGEPADVPLPPERPAELGGQSQFRNPLDAGIKFLQSTFGLKANTGAVPGEQSDQLHQQGVKRLMTGEGAATPEEYQQATSRVDPDGTMRPALRNIATLEAVYEYYLQRGEPEKAQKAVASLVQYTQLQARRYGAAAVDALQKGDTAKGVQYLKAGYDSTPDGNEVEADPQTGQYAVKDAKSGKVVHQGKFTPQDLIQQALGLRNGNAYWDHLIEAAANQKPMTRAQQEQIALQKQRLAAQERDADAMATFATQLGGAEDGADAGGDEAATPGAPAVDPGRVARDPSDDQLPPQAGVTPGVNPAPAPGAVNASPRADAGASTPAVDPNAAPAQSAAGEDLLQGSAGSPALAGGTDTLETQKAVASPPGALPRPQMTPEMKKLMAGASPRTQMQMQRLFYLNKVRPWEQEQKQRLSEEAAEKRAAITDRRRAEDEEKRIAAEQRRDKYRLEGEARVAERRLEGEARLQQQRLEAEERHAATAAAKPTDISTLDPEQVTKVHGMVDEGLRSVLSSDDPKATPLDPLKKYGKAGLQGLRDAAVTIMRYNKVPADTAAATIVAMTEAGKAGASSFSYVVEPIKGLPDDPVEGQRVRVRFRDKSAVVQSIILPKGTVDRIDVLRGRQDKQAYDREVVGALPGIQEKAENERKAVLEEKVMAPQRTTTEGDIPAQLKRRLADPDINRPDRALEKKRLQEELRKFQLRSDANQVPAIPVR